MDTIIDTKSNNRLGMLSDVIRLEFLLTFFLSILYGTCVEKGVCFRTALGESLCGSLLCCTILTDGRQKFDSRNCPYLSQYSWCTE